MDQVFQKPNQILFLQIQVDFPMVTKLLTSQLIVRLCQKVMAVWRETTSFRVEDFLTI